MQGKQVFRIIIGILAIMALTLILGSSAGAADYKTLHKFKQTGVGGYGLFGGLTFDAAGNLYGTTWSAAPSDMARFSSSRQTEMEAGPRASSIHSTSTTDAYPYPV